MEPIPDRGTPVTTPPVDLEEKIRRNREAIRNFTLFDDLFMTQVFADNLPATQMLLSTILSRSDMIIDKVTTQLALGNLYGRSARLDVYARDLGGRQFDIEVQERDSGAVPERARLNSSLFDSRLTSPGMKFEELPETYVIFITRNDVLRGNRPTYTIERTVLESGDLFGDRAHIVYVNGAWRGDDPIGRLMHDFSCRDYREMYNPALAGIVRTFKEEKGDEEMSEILDKLIEEEVAATDRRVRREFAVTLWNSGERDLKKIASMTRLPMSEVEEALSLTAV